MNDESDSRMVRLPVREMRDEPAPPRAAQEGDLPPLPHWCEAGSPMAQQMQSYARLALAAAGGGVAHGSVPIDPVHWCIQWIRDNYQDHPTIDGLCAAMLASSPQPEAEQEQPEKCGNRDYCGRFPFCGCGGPEPLPERDTSKPAEQQGLFRKFDVRRTDGSDKPGGKHYGCEYFVLDVAHDKHAKAALAAYAAAVEETNPHLAQDMRDRYELSTPAQPEAAPAVAQVPCALDVTLTRDEAEYIAAFIDPECQTEVDDVVRLMVGGGHSGHGLYAAHPEYPEEGAVFVKAVAAPEAPAQAELTGCSCRWDKDNNRVQTCARHQGWLDVVHEWAARAKDAEWKLTLALEAPAQGKPDHTGLLRMIAHRARCFPSYPLGYHIPEVFSAIGEAPPQSEQPSAGEVERELLVQLVLSAESHRKDRDWESMIVDLREAAELAAISHKEQP